MTPAEQVYRERVKRNYPVGSCFGRLTITGHKRRKDGVWLLICRCSCGKEKIIDHACHLRNGLVKSCGCLNRELSSSRRKGKAPACQLARGVAALNLVFRTYRLWAKRKNREFSLTQDEFIKITQRNCHYCGQPPTQRWKSKYNGAAIFNGVDRRNNEDGYTASNSVPCCKICNRAKSNLTESDFLNWIDRVHKHRNYSVSC